jgi:hypothetical protein
MEYSDADPSFRARFLEPKFEPDSFVQSIGKSIFLLKFFFLNFYFFLKYQNQLVVQI